MGRAVANRRIFPYLVFVTVALCLIAAFAMTLLDREDFPSFGISVWWAVQTISTVGYGDVVPHSTWGRVLGSLVILLGVTFLTFVTAIVTSLFVTDGAGRGRRGGTAAADRGAGGGNGFVASN